MWRQRYTDAGRDVNGLSENMKSGCELGENFSSDDLRVLRVY